MTYYDQLFLFERTTPGVSFCQTQLQINPNDMLVIRGCLKANRAQDQPRLLAGIGEPRSISRPKLGLGSGATDQRLFDAACDETALGAAIGTR
jgi:hypothetical protein